MIHTSWPRTARVCGPFFLLALLLVVPACSDDGGGPQDPPFFDVAAVASWPEVRDCRFSIEHDGVQIAVYISPGAETAYTQGIYPLPEGTVLVKAEHDDPDCAEPLEYTAMRKLATGAATGDGDWAWQRVDASGRVLASGSLPQCVSCHRACTEGRDFTCTDP